eukprot:10517883-Lingulodinium_polyedra.AAC.1
MCIRDSPSGLARYAKEHSVDARRKPAPPIACASLAEGAHRVDVEVLADPHHEVAPVLLFPLYKPVGSFDVELEGGERRGLG